MHKTGFTLVYFNFYLFFSCYLFSFFFLPFLPLPFPFIWFTIHFSSWFPFLSRFAFNVQKHLWRPVTRSILGISSLADRALPLPLSFLLHSSLISSIHFSISSILSSKFFTFSFLIFPFFFYLLYFSSFFFLQYLFFLSSFSLLSSPLKIAPFYCHCYFFSQTSNSFAFFLPSLILLLAPTPFCLLIFPVFSPFFFLHNL